MHNLPPLEQLQTAIDRYLALAYNGGNPPAAVKARLAAIQSCDDASLGNCTCLECDPAHHKICLRLGNRFYPHMKLVVEQSPDGLGFLFRADTHDIHCRPAPESKEHNLFCKLMKDNQTLAEAIEASWDEAGLPTFKKYLRDDLQRRLVASNL